MIVSQGIFNVATVLDVETQLANVAFQMMTVLEGVVSAMVVQMCAVLMRPVSFSSVAIHCTDVHGI